MTISYLYYANPFGINADDLTSIPMNAAPDGSVSYYGGWTDPYEYNLNTNPAALPIPRGQMNQLFYDITLNLSQYQNYGTPMWVSSAEIPQSGTPGYPIYARVYYNGIVYESQAANNTTTPGSSSTWLQISGASDGIQSGMVIDWAGPVAPAGYLLCDGSAVSRSTYANLFAAITQTIASAGLTFTASNPTVTGFTNALTTMYPGMTVECANFSGGSTTVLTVNSNSSVTFSANSTSSVAANITCFNWGHGNGTTTFNVPDFRNRVTAGEGGSLLANAGAQGDVVGQTTGVANTSNFPNHSHTVGGGSSAFITTPGTSAGGSGTSWTSTSATDVAGTGATMSIVQPTAIMYKIIKT